MSTRGFSLLQVKKIVTKATTKDQIDVIRACTMKFYSHLSLDLDSNYFFSFCPSDIFIWLSSPSLNQANEGHQKGSMILFSFFYLLLLLFVAAIVELPMVTVSYMRTSSWRLI